MKLKLGGRVQYEMATTINLINQLLKLENPQNIICHRYWSKT
jgi:hypothetical protein